MKDFGPDTFGELNAADYDDVHDPGTTHQAVDLIAEIVGSGRSILEFAIGSGRLALPLQARGFQLSGIDASAKMVDLLRAKPQGQNMPVTIGDMATTRLDQKFDHVLLAYNTLFNLTSQRAQIQCFQNAADHLHEGGTFLIETFIPDLFAFHNNQQLRTMRLDMQSVWIEASKLDPLTQTIEMQRIRITDQGLKLVPLPMRYALPPELDLMAELAGMRLKNRWGNWDKTDFTAESKMHISVYEKT